MSKILYHKHQIEVTQFTYPAGPDTTVEPPQMIRVEVTKFSGRTQLTLAQFRALVAEWAHILEDVYDG